MPVDSRQVGLRMFTGVRTHSDLIRLVRARSPLGPEETEAVIRERFWRMPSTLEVPLRRFHLDQKRTLDVGCAFGHCLVHFGPGSVGLDVVEEKVAFARNLGLEALRCDLDQGLDVLGDRRFEAIWCSDVFEHLHAPFAVLCELADRLEEGGLLIAYVTIRPGNPLVRWAWKRWIGWKPYAVTTHHYQFTLATFRYLLSRSGLRTFDQIVPGIRSQAGNRLVARSLGLLFPSIVLVSMRDPDLVRIRAEGIRKNRQGKTGD